ncbi:MAG TPA: hypothetical protein VK689_21150, partial [Armatimonadota bacterium]|nr:hypothetical protein [Armatimonadota bacterium]
MIPRQHRVSTLWASLLLMCALPASAAVVSDDFNDNDLNEGLFTLGTLGTGPELEEREQRLEVRLPATSSGEDFFYGVTTRPLFRGDLDAQVDFQMLDYPPANGVRLGIIIQGPEGGPTALQRTSFSERELSAGPREGYLLHSGDELEQHPSEDLAGKLRLTRVGTTVTGYFWDAATEAWVPFASLPGTDTNVHISLAVWSHDRAFADQDVRVAFDNFVVNSGQVVGAVLPDLAGRWLQ